MSAEIKCSYCKKDYKREKNAMNIKKDILNKMMKENYDAYKAKDILGYRRSKPYAAAVKEKKSEARQGQRESENTSRRF